MLNRSNLHAYQERAIEFIKTTKRCLLTLDMGLGKTGIGSVLAENLYEKKLIRHGSVLIVAPKSLHDEHNWEGEIDKFSNLTLINLRSDIRDLDNPYADCFIINAEYFDSKRFRLCIIR